MDEDELIAADYSFVNKPWRIFLERATLIAQILGLVTNIKYLNVIIDMNLSRRENNDIADFYRSLSSIIQIIGGKKKNILQANMTVTDRCDIPTLEHMYLSPLITQLGAHIQSVHIGDASGWSESELYDLCVSVGPLTCLKIRNANSISEKLLSNIHQMHSKTLHTLDLSNCKRLDDVYLLNELAPCLKNLDLSASIRTWSRNDGSYPGFSGRRLRNLSVSKCPRLPDSFFKVLAEGAYCITKLNVQETLWNDEHFNVLLKSARYIEEIDAQSCPGLSAKCLDILAASRAKHLKVLKLTGNSSIVDSEKSPANIHRISMSCIRVNEISLGPIFKNRCGWKGWSILSKISSGNPVDDIKEFFCDRYLVLNMRNVLQYNKKLTISS